MFVKMCEGSPIPGMIEMEVTRYVLWEMSMKLLMKIKVREPL